MKLKECVICQKKFKSNRLKYTCIDHIIPVVNGGVAKMDNLQPLCRSCNARKGGRGKEWLERMKKLKAEKKQAYSKKELGK